MAKHYDVVVLGASLGSLSAAALLARRSWRVLVLGQGQRSPLYSFLGLPLARRPFTFLAGRAPIWKRILVELTQSQTFRRQVQAQEPRFQVIGPRIRASALSDKELFAREIDREFPEVRRVVDELSQELVRANDAIDIAFEQDVVWSPGTFWERRETARAAASLPYANERARDLLSEFPRGHAYRTLVDVPTAYASDSARLPLVPLARIHDAWMRGAVGLSGGEEDLIEFLVERVRAHGGEVALGDRASRIVVRGGRVTAIDVDDDDELTGVQFVVTDLPSTALLDLAVDYRPSRRALDARPRTSIAAQRFVASLLVHEEGVPAALAADAFLLPSTSGDPDRPPVHLQSWIPKGTTGMRLLVGEMFVAPPHAFDPALRRRARAHIVAEVERYLPYIERHYILVDSPHDGLPAWDYRSGSRVHVERTELRTGGGTIDAEPMRPVFATEGSEELGFGGEPTRFPPDGVFGVGPSVLPALGQEGELLAAWGAARVITRTDRRREKMRREMWSKVELG